MNNPFPPPIQNLPVADIPLDGLTAYLSQGDGHQIIFMHFKQDAELPAHSHAAQWGLVLAGEIDVAIDGVNNTYRRGDTYFIPSEVEHAVKIYAGYADITYFDQPDRYQARPSK